MEKLDSKSLMLGDWVRRRWTCRDTGREVVQDFQVTEIRKNGETLYAWSKSGNMGRVEELEPIPITPEILEKNGFGYKEEDENFAHYYLGEPHFCKDMGLHIGSNKKGAYCTNIGYNDIYGLRYVHELQHALRLCGIEKEIEL